jgi:hypothetical protein
MLFAALRNVAPGTKRTYRDLCLIVCFRREADIRRSRCLLWSDANDPNRTQRE